MCILRVGLNPSYILFKSMQSLAERVPSGWWVAKTTPGKTLKFAEYLTRDADNPVEHFVPIEGKKRPLVPYVFIRAEGKPGAWMSPGFRGWILTNGTRAVVPDVELDTFRLLLNELNKPAPKLPKSRILLRINANTEIRATL